MEPRRLVLIIAGAVVALGAVAAVVWKQGDATGPQPTVAVTTTPSGATVIVNGKDVGTTPWFADNTWQGAVPVEVSLPGFRPWKGSFVGGSEQRVEVTLQRLGKKKVSRVEDAGVVEVEVEMTEPDIDPEALPHKKGPLRPPDAGAPADQDFVDQDLDREAADQHVR
jgi:hypothetical protein